MAVKTFAVADVLKEAFEPLTKRIEVAFIYGSFAEGREDSESDIDLAIIGSLSLAGVSRVLREAEQKLGREVNVTIYPAMEFRSKVKDGHHFVNSILRGRKSYRVRTLRGALLIGSNVHDTRTYHTLIGVVSRSSCDYPSLAYRNGCICPYVKDKSGGFGWRRESRHPNPISWSVTAVY